MRKWGRRPACHCLVGRKFLSGSITDSREGSDPRADAEDGSAAAESAGEGGVGLEDWGEGVRGEMNHQGITEVHKFNQLSEQIYG